MDFVRIFAEAFWFFLPAFTANMAPGWISSILRALGKSEWNTPVNARLLGEKKTWPAYPAAAAAAIATIYLERWSDIGGFLDYHRPDLWLVGAAFGVGAVVGDQGESFLKRRLGIPSGSPWFPWDQFDYVFGGLLVSLPLTGWIGIVHAGILFPFVCVYNPIGNWIWYKLGQRPRVL